MDDIVRLQRVEAALLARVDELTEADPEDAPGEVARLLLVLERIRDAYRALHLLFLRARSETQPPPSTPTDEVPRQTPIPLHGAGSSLSPPLSSMHGYIPVEGVAA